MAGCRAARARSRPLAPSARCRPGTGTPPPGRPAPRRRRRDRPADRRCREQHRQRRGRRQQREPEGERLSPKTFGRTNGSAQEKHQDATERRRRRGRRRWAARAAAAWTDVSADAHRPSSRSVKSDVSIRRDCCRVAATCRSRSGPAGRCRRRPRAGSAAPQPRCRAATTSASQPPDGTRAGVPRTQASARIPLGESLSCSTATMSTPASAAASSAAPAAGPAPPAGRGEQRGCRRIGLDGARTSGSSRPPTTRFAAGNPSSARIRTGRFLRPLTTPKYTDQAGHRGRRRREPLGAFVGLLIVSRPRSTGPDRQQPGVAEPAGDHTEGVGQEEQPDRGNRRSACTRIGLTTVAGRSRSGPPTSSCAAAAAGSAAVFRVPQK